MSAQPLLQHSRPVGQACVGSSRGCTRPRARRPRPCRTAHRWRSRALVGGRVCRPGRRAGLVVGAAGLATSSRPLVLPVAAGGAAGECTARKGARRIADRHRRDGRAVGRARDGDAAPANPCAIVALPSRGRRGVAATAAAAAVCEGRRGPRRGRASNRDPEDMAEGKRGAEACLHERRHESLTTGSDIEGVARGPRDHDGTWIEAAVKIDGAGSMRPEAARQRPAAHAPASLGPRGASARAAGTSTFPRDPSRLSPRRPRAHPLVHALRRASRNRGSVRRERTTR